MTDQIYDAYRLTFKFSRTGITALDEENAGADVQMVWEPGCSPHCLISCGASLGDADEFQLSQENFRSAEKAWEIARRYAKSLCVLAALKKQNPALFNLAPGFLSKPNSSIMLKRWRRNEELP
jgi:hypothetical protein